LSQRIPQWLVPRAPKRPQLERLGGELKAMGLHTVCQSARCPNLGECFGRGTATFMILGDRCTRDCRFCAVQPAEGGPALPDPNEPRRVAEAADRLGLRHVVVTSVTRDDLADGGAGQFAATIGAIRELLPAARVEVLVPDFGGDWEALQVVLVAAPDVLNHNVETVPRLYPQVRPQADYQRSLALLRRAGESAEGRPVVTKSGLMVGLGESEEEVLGVLDDLRRAGVAAITIGQYLQPTRSHLAVAEYVRPEQFERYGQKARAMGFRHVMSGPLVRSSYHAADLLGAEARLER
jgi:lipoic acid synthetase